MFRDHREYHRLIGRLDADHFRWLNRLLAQVGGRLQIDGLEMVTRKVMEAARQSLVIGES